MRFNPCATWISGLLLSCVAVTGCGSNGAPELGTVHGKLLYKGAPLANVRVELCPEVVLGPKCLLASGVTKADGSFELLCDDGRPGATIGWHQITLRHVDTEVRGNPRDDNAPPPAYSPPKLSLAPNDSLATTTLRREVVAGDNTIEITIP